MCCVGWKRVGNYHKWRKRVPDRCTSELLSYWALSKWVIELYWVIRSYWVIYVRLVLLLRILLLMCIHIIINYICMWKLQYRSVLVKSLSWLSWKYFYTYVNRFYYLCIRYRWIFPIQCCHLNWIPICCFNSMLPYMKHILNSRKLKVLIDKMELMRWLISKLVTSRTGDYDWTSDPHRRLKALALARQKHTIQNYTESWIKYMSLFDFYLLMLF